MEAQDVLRLVQQRRSPWHPAAEDEETTLLHFKRLYIASVDGMTDNVWSKIVEILGEDNARWDRKPVKKVTAFKDHSFRKGEE